MVNSQKEYMIITMSIVVYVAVTAKINKLHNYKGELNEDGAEISLHFIYLLAVYSNSKFLILVLDSLCTICTMFIINK